MFQAAQSVASSKFGGKGSVDRRLQTGSSAGQIELYYDI